MSFFFFLFISLIKIFYFLPSDLIWKKTQLYMENGKMLVKNRNFFIFDESNYTALDINSPIMNKLYQKQENFFQKYNISNYIFIVDNLDEKQESIESATFNLCKYLCNNYSINMNRSTVALFSIKSRRVRLRSGDKIKHELNNDRLKKIIDNLVPYLKNEKYYKAWNKLIDDLKFYYVYGNAIDNFLIVLIIIILIYCFYGQYIKKYLRRITATHRYISLDKDANLRKIVNFLKKERTNKKILTDNCAICLEQFNDIKKNNNEEKNSEEKDIVTERQINVQDSEKNDISTLECGHQFHTECIAKWMERKNECPLCRQKINNKYNQNDAQMVWGVQNELYENHYDYISYNDLFSSTIFIDYSSSYYRNNNDNNNSNNDSDYSFSGGHDSGGGATGS